VLRLGLPAHHARVSPLACRELVVGSDADPDALSLAERNLSLLIVGGMDERIAQTAWRDAPPPTTNGLRGPEWQLLDALHMIVTPRTVLAITSAKRQKIAHDAFQRLEQFQVGKRRTQLFVMTE
jgi:hypothetical protein